MTGTAIVTTTINHPVETFTELARAGTLVVAGDVKTPMETGDLVRRLGGVYLEPGAQSHWVCSEVIGWNSIQRRNIAFLEAARLGFDTVITVDDDNCPSDAVAWMAHHEKALATPPMAVYTTKCGWFNPGSMLEPSVVARGMPYNLEDREHMDVRLARPVDPDEPPRIGVNAGLWTGDPDIDAMQRLVRAPIVERLKTGIQVPIQSGTFAPINSQNTAWRRELLPLACVFPGVGRWDDIFGGYTAQWSFWAANYVAAFGLPLVSQDRNDHDLFIDLIKEVDGYSNTVPWIQMLQQLEATGDPLTDLAQVANWLYKPHNRDKWEPVWQFISAWAIDWETIA